MKRWTTLPATLLVVAACDTPAPSPDGELVERDSAGGVIAEWSGPIWTSEPRWTIGEPATSIGALEGDEPEYLFSGIRAVVALTDGRIVVADGGSNTLRWYDASGVFLMQRGGSGEGPGEFSRLGPIVRTPDDGLVITDGALHRITHFSSEGELVMTTPIAGLAVPGPPHPLGDGAFVVGSTGFSSSQLTGDEEGLYRTSEPLIRVLPETEAVDTLGIFPGPEIYFRTRSFGGHPFSRGFHYGTAGDRVFVAAAEGFVVDVHAGDGRHLRSIRAPAVDLTLTVDLIDAYEAEALRLAAERGGQAESSTRSELADMIHPDERPAYRRMVVGEDAIWLEQHSGGVAPASSRWAVFGHDGAFQGTAEFPVEFRLSAVGDGRVVGSWRDSLGVEYARAYALVEAGG